jgi:hypothetical protein
MNGGRRFGEVPSWRFWAIAGLVLGSVLSVVGARWAHANALESAQRMRVNLQYRSWLVPGRATYRVQVVDAITGQPVQDALVEPSASLVVPDPPGEKLPPHRTFETRRTDADGWATIPIEWSEPLEHDAQLEVVVTRGIERDVVKAHLRRKLPPDNVVTDDREADRSATRPRHRELKLALVPEANSFLPGVPAFVYAIASYDDGRPATTQITRVGSDELFHTSELGVARLTVTPSRRSRWLFLDAIATDEEGRLAQATLELPMALDDRAFLLRNDPEAGSGQLLVRVLSRQDGPVFVNVLAEGRELVADARVNVMGGEGVFDLKLTQPVAPVLLVEARRATDVWRRLLIPGRTGDSVSDIAAAMSSPALDSDVLRMAPWLTRTSTAGDGRWAQEAVFAAALYDATPHWERDVSIHGTKQRWNLSAIASNESLESKRERAREVTLGQKRDLAGGCAILFGVATIGLLLWLGLDGLRQWWFAMPALLGAEELRSARKLLRFSLGGGGLGVLLASIVLLVGRGWVVAVLAVFLAAALAWSARKFETIPTATTGHWLARAGWALVAAHVGLQLFVWWLGAGVLLPAAVWARGLSGGLAVSGGTVVGLVAAAMFAHLERVSPARGLAFVVGGPLLVGVGIAVVSVAIRGSHVPRTAASIGCSEIERGVVHRWFFESLPSVENCKRRREASRAEASRAATEYRARFGLGPAAKIDVAGPKDYPPDLRVPGGFVTNQLRPAHGTASRP